VVNFILKCVSNDGISSSYFDYNYVLLLRLVFWHFVFMYNWGESFNVSISYVFSIKSLRECHKYCNLSLLARIPTFDNIDNFTYSYHVAINHNDASSAEKIEPTNSKHLKGLKSHNIQLCINFLSRLFLQHMLILQATYSICVTKDTNVQNGSLHVLL